MIHIDQRQLNVDATWQALATKRTAEVLSKPLIDDKKKWIKKHGALWTSPRVKKELERISNKKCWYCESLEKRSDRHVDHFRPKNNVKDSTHEGYYWLAFKHENYRLACTYCNCHRSDRENGEVLGKGDRFPLENPDNRVTDPRTPYSRLLRQENATLIDPIKRSDISLLAYHPDGRVVETYGKYDITHEKGYLRAKKSIDLYHLNEVEIKEARQALYEKIETLILRGDGHFQYAYEQDTSAEDAFEEILDDLCDLRKSSSEYSAFAKAMIASFRDSNLRPWLDHLDAW